MLKLNFSGRNHNWIIREQNLKELLDKKITSEKGNFEITGVISAFLSRVNDTGCWLLFASLVESIKSCFITPCYRNDVGLWTLL